MELNMRSNNHERLTEVLVRATERWKSDNPIVLRGEVSHCPKILGTLSDKNPAVINHCFLYQVPAFFQVLLWQLANTRLATRRLLTWDAGSPSPAGVSIRLCDEHPQGLHCLRLHTLTTCPSPWCRQHDCFPRLLTRSKWATVVRPLAQFESSAFKTFFQQSVRSSSVKTSSSGFTPHSSRNLSPMTAGRSKSAPNSKRILSLV